MAESKIQNPKSKTGSFAGIVLAGGQSTRMGRAKAALPFGPELMLTRVVRLLGQVVSPIVVVGAPLQALPALPGGVLIARDDREARGPLEGLLAGLSLIATLADAAYVTSCDVPLLRPALVAAMLGRLGDADIAVPIEGQFCHPLAAVYRVAVLDHIRTMLARDQLRLTDLLDHVRTCRFPVEELRATDPELHSLRNLNRPEDYLAALHVAGIEPDPAVVKSFETRHT